jgi:UDP-2,4-diacetamido-2,4,6-trideoxy-beta-L-altropyranose hydrolase
LVSWRIGELANPNRGVESFGVTATGGSGDAMLKSPIHQITNPPIVLFTAAAGPRIGFGHLVRCRSLARALGIAPVVALRGTAATCRRALDSGWTVVDAQPGDALARSRPQVLVVDDPSPAVVREWTGQARRVGLPVATIHDLGLCAVESDIAIDGSPEVATAIRGRFATLRGTAYAILDPSVRAAREARSEGGPRRVLIALGGGGHVFGLAARVAEAVSARVQGAEIRVASGFVATRRLPLLQCARWIEAPGGLAAELSATSVAIVAGGITLYEACAVGVPAVAVAVSPGQRPTIRAFARRGAVVDAGAASDLGRTVTRVASAVERLLEDPMTRRRVGIAGPRVVDGRGAFRVADWLRRLPALAAETVHVA